MSNFRSPRNAEEIASPSLSPSSDEKMDTGSESFRSQDTPNSIVSSDFDSDHQDNVLRLQNPIENNVLRLSKPDANDTNYNNINENVTDSFVAKMSNLNIDSPKEIMLTDTDLPAPEILYTDSAKLNFSPKDVDSPKMKFSKLDTDSPKVRPKTFAVSTPRVNSSLVLTTDHPLMNSNSIYPDVIPKKVDVQDISGIEEEKHEEIFTSSLYSPQRNNSKSNLYMAENFITTENFITAESQMLETSQPPDVARVEKRKKIIVPKFNENISEIKCIVENESSSFESKNDPGSQNGIDVPDSRFYSGVADWCESPSQLKKIPNFQLPLESSAQIRPDHVETHSNLTSPEDRSQYEASVDPLAGRVTLKHTHRHTHTHSHSHTHPHPQRRKIQLPPEEDRGSLDSLSSSFDSEDEPDMPGVGDQSDQEQDEVSSKSKSTTTSSHSTPIPEYSATEELNEERSWMTVSNQGVRNNCDVKVISPFRRALSHGGYSPTGAAIIVFSACHLPDNGRPDYTYVMDNLFLYVIWTLERLVTDEYILVYLHGSAGRGRLPSFRWLLECYRLIDRRLRKSLKHLYLVHPTFWLKSLVYLTKPFVSSKFFRKLTYVRSLSELEEKIHVEPNAIPEIVKQFDESK